MFELDGILIVGIPVAIDLAHAAQSRPLAGDLRAADLVAAEEVFLGSHVRAITLRLAEKDEYTEQHTRRVALRAVQVGELLGLSPSRLRTLAIGGLVHDIGKLSVPDAILKKPGPLDDDEYALVQRHPEWGAKLLDELGGFSDPVRSLVRDHHERLDGTGYPRGLSAERDRSRHADPHRLRRLRRADLAARLPPRLDARAGDGAAARRDRHRVRRAVRRGARTGARGRKRSTRPQQPTARTQRRYPARA